jgi:hypothetical protein
MHKAYIVEKEVSGLDGKMTVFYDFNFRQWKTCPTLVFDLPTAAKVVAQEPDAKVVTINYTIC